MNDDTKSPFENPQTATGGSYVRMPDQSLVKVEGHDVPDADRETLAKFRDAVLADAQAKHEADIAAALAAVTKAVEETKIEEPVKPTLEGLMEAAGLKPAIEAPSVSAPAKLPPADVTSAPNDTTSSVEARRQGGAARRAGTSESSGE